MSLIYFRAEFEDEEKERLLSPHGERSPRMSVVEHEIQNYAHGDNTTPDLENKGKRAVHPTT